MHTPKHQYQKKIVLSLVLASISQSAWSSSLQMIEQNVTNLGTGYAGTAALAEDASTNYYNTAGLTRVGIEQIVGGGVLLLPHTTLNVTSATSTFGTLLSPSTGSTRPSNTALIPFLHYAKRIDDRWVFGFSIVAPYGSKTNYQINSLPRYMDTRSELKTIDLAPSLAYEFNNGFSIGGGVDALYLISKLDSQIGSGNIYTDGFTKNTAKNWAIGYHVGGLYEFSNCTRFGIQYHSQYTVNAKGDSITQLAAGAPITRQGARGDVNLPAFVVLSAYHAFDEQWAMMADLEWDRSSRFKHLIFRFDDNSQLILNENYKNTYRIAAGGSYQYNEPWRFRVGVMFDKSPIPAASRNIFIPNPDTISPAIGAQYRICKTVAVDFGYAHVFFKKDNNINQPAPVSVNRLQGLQNVQGSIKNRLDAIGLQVTWDIES